MPVGEPRPWIMIGLGLTPGESTTLDGWVFEELTPGRHRVAKDLAGPDGSFFRATEFEVLPG